MKTPAPTTGSSTLPGPAPVGSGAPTGPAGKATQTEQYSAGLLGRLGAEGFGSFIVVLLGLGLPLFILPQLSPLSSALATGLTISAVMLAFAYVSGGHFNPAVTVGHLVAGRIRLADAAGYVVAQVVGSVLAAVALFGILRTVPSIQDTRAAFDTVTAGYGEHAVSQMSWEGVLLVEVLGSAILVAVFLAATARDNRHRLLAPLAVGFTMAALLQLGQATGNAPFNPARATASSLFGSSWAVAELWVFWAAPVVGAVVAGLISRLIAGSYGASAAARDALRETDDADALEAFDAGDEPAEGTVAEDSQDTVTDRGAGKRAPTSGPDASSPAVPAASATDDARDFFDGKNR
ncbi:aquaporin [Pseudarthrobacter sp. PS3-L1]|uniref:MIP/aquaporin family protein n=1 Tax=Pseudarthrobacter sp. PS3-L1 TaxID=3046207 RepID=UPI0024BAC886|nr:aquaporin [Pseudarthrobacter sp. PS3-L1]MDJ0321609.1 aquaporin [Pseudarthrobacter sp. PS3-L1]